MPHYIHGPTVLHGRERREWPPYTRAPTMHRDNLVLLGVGGKTGRSKGAQPDAVPMEDGTKWITEAWMDEMTELCMDLTIACIVLSDLIFAKEFSVQFAFTKYMNMVLRVISINLEMGACINQEYVVALGGVCTPPAENSSRSQASTHCTPCREIHQAGQSGTAPEKGGCSDANTTHDHRMEA